MTPGERPILTPGLTRARLRLRKRAPPRAEAPPRKAAAILTMVDLLSCAFGGGIFLFLLTAAPPGNLAKASPNAMTKDGLLIIEVASEMVRPIFVLSQVRTGHSFIVDGQSLLGRSAMRRVANAYAGTRTGNVYAVGTTPWDVEDGSTRRSLILRFEQPVSEWCLRYATADDDSSARERGLNQIKEARITVRIQKPGMRAEEIGAGQVKLMPAPLQLSQCLNFSFGG